MKPNSDTAATTMTALKDADRNSRTSSIGVRARSSTRTKPTSPAAEANHAAAASGLV